MKYIALVLLLLVTGCKKEERFVILAEKCLPTTTSIYVDGTTEQFTINLSSTGSTVTKSTVPVTVLGAGVFISPDNYVLTVNHLFEHGTITSISVCDNYETCTAGELIHTDVSNDLALVKANFDEPTLYVRLADPRTLKVGQEVMAIGTPLGFPFSVTHGIISALYRDFGMGYNLTQSDASINPGNSGGGLFNLNGELVGINQSIVPPINQPVFTGLGFSVQTSQIIEFLVDCRKKAPTLQQFNSEYWE